MSTAYTTEKPRALIHAYCPLSPVSSKLSSSKMNSPGFEKSGMNRVTSLRYVQIIPSKVGSGVDVRQTVKKWIKTPAEGPFNIRRRTFGILESENSKTVKLGLVGVIHRTAILISKELFTPFDVTVKFKLMPAQEPTGPQSVGGL